MDIKILFIFLVLLLTAKSFTKEYLSKDFMSEASGGLLKKKDNKMPGGTFNNDPNSATFNSDLNTFIEQKAGDDRAVVVDKDTSGLEVNKPAKVEETLGKDLQEEEGSGCNDILVFGLVLLFVIYTVYFKIKN